MHLGLVMNVVPDNDVVDTPRNGPTHGEHKPSIKSSSQQLTDFTALVRVRQKRTANGAFKRLARVWMFILAYYNDN